MSKLYDIAVVGGHGLVCKAIIKDLLNSDIAINSLTVYGSKEHADIGLNIEGHIFKIEVLDEEDIKHYDLVFFSTGEDLSYKYAPLFVNKGARVIDNSSYFRMDKKVPLIIPEINEMDLLDDSKIYANPNCTTILTLLALYPVHQCFELEKIIVSSYQAVSGAGTLALQEFINEGLNEHYEAKILPSKNVIKKPIYNNILPVVDEVLSDGWSKEENKMENESKKILHMPDLEINPTCVRVPTITGHGASIAAICKKKIDLEYLIKQYANTDFVRLRINDDYPDVREVVNTHYVDVGRLRIDKYCEYTVDLFATSDNLIRGASYNAVEIARSLIKLGVL